MKALIAAAGIGARLLPKTVSLPKCLVEIGSKSIVDYQLNALKMNGIKDVTIITGYKARLIREKVKKGVKLIHNSIYDKTNSSYSVWLSRESIKGGFLYLNSDLMLDHRVIDRILSDSSENSICIDSGHSNSDDMFRVRLKNKRVVGMNKKYPAESSDGVAVGPFKLSSSGRDILFRKLDELIEKKVHNNWMYTILSELADELNLTWVDIKGMPWVEIDDNDDYELARRKLDEFEFNF